MRLAYTTIAALVAVFASNGVVSTNIAPKAVSEPDVPHRARLTGGDVNDVGAKRFPREAHGLKDPIAVQPADEERSNVSPVAEEVAPLLDKAVEDGGLGKVVETMWYLAIKIDEAAGKLQTKHKTFFEKVDKIFEPLNQRLLDIPTLTNFADKLGGYIDKFLDLKVGGKSIHDRHDDAMLRVSKAEEAGEEAGTAVNGGVHPKGDYQPVVIVEDRPHGEVKPAENEEGRLEGEIEPGVAS